MILFKRHLETINFQKSGRIQNWPWKISSFPSHQQQSCWVRNHGHIPTHNSFKDYRISWNKSNQGSERPLPWKLQISEEKDTRKWKEIDPPAFTTVMLESRHVLPSLSGSRTAKVQMQNFMDTRQALTNWPTFPTQGNNVEDFECPMFRFCLRKVYKAWLPMVQPFLADYCHKASIVE